MQLLDLTLDSPEKNLALDEALLESAEAGKRTRELLRFWESPELVAVVGRASKVEQEVNVAMCEQYRTPILRRCSGGAAIVAGPGCLMYALILDCRNRPHLKMIPEAHRLVMETLAAALQPIVAGVRFDGTCDLTIGDRKFSGNSLRCKRNWLLYHGTVLYDFRLETIESLLRTPPRQPSYRQGRSHQQFVTNLPAGVDLLKHSIAQAWHASEAIGDWPREDVENLVARRYSQPSWNRRL